MSHLFFFIRRESLIYDDKVDIYFITINKSIDVLVRENRCILFLFPLKALYMCSRNK
jgi:hypothetical protein